MTKRWILNEAHHEPQGDASYNPDKSVTNKHVSREIHTTKVRATCLHSHNNSNSHLLRKAVRKIPSSMDLDTKRKWVLRVILQAQQTACHKDQPLQQLHIHHKLEDHLGLPQSTIRTEITRIHQNCNGTTNGSTRAPADGKGPGPTKGKNKMSEPHPGTSSGTGSAAQPADPSKNTIVCSACGESGHWSRNCPYYNFCDICRVTTHSTCMCRASKHGNTTAGSPVCIYCGKTNHGSAYCRYRPRDNHEVPRHTPDVLKNWYCW